MGKYLQKQYQPRIYSTIKVIQIVCHARSLDHTTQIFRQIDILKTYDIIYFNTCIFMYMGGIYYTSFNYFSFLFPNMYISSCITCLYVVQVCKFYVCISWKIKFDLIVHINIYISCRNFHVDK